MPIRSIAIAFAASAVLSSGVASAQDYPSETITVVVPFTAGGFNDTIGRTVAEMLSAEFDQQAVVENRTGAGGNIGTEYVAMAEPDGHTLMIGSTPMVFGTFRNEKPPFDPVEDFAPIAMTVETVNVFVVHSDLPVDTLQELVDYVKANPGALNYGSSSLIGTSHLGMELFKARAGIDIQHIPYAGSSALLPDLLANRVSATVDNLQFLLPHIEAGTLKALAVTNEKRSALVPDVPTIAEAGFPGAEISSWLGVFAPAGTPDDVVQRLNEVITAGFEDEQYASRFPGAQVVTSTPDELGAYVQNQLDTWGELISSRGIELD